MQGPCPQVGRKDSSQLTKAKGLCPPVQLAFAGAQHSENTCLPTAPGLRVVQEGLQEEVAGSRAPTLTAETWTPAANTAWVPSRQPMGTDFPQEGKTMLGANS